MIAGMEWIIIIVAIALLLFGAKKIPEFARGLGKAKAEFHRGQMMVEQEIREERNRQKSEERKKENDYINAAKALGIETDGKSESEIKKEIAKHVA